VLKISQSGAVGSADLYPHSVHTSEMNRVDLGNDLSLIRVVGMRFKDRLDHFPETLTLPPHMEGFIGGYPTSVEFVESTFKAHNDELGEVKYKNYTKYSLPTHGKGDCGLPLVARTGAGSCIVSIHSAGSIKTSAAYGSVIQRSVIEKGIKKLQDKFPLEDIISESEDVLGPLLDPVPKSPFRHEVLHSLTYYGRLPGPVMAHGRSRLKRTPFYKQVTNLFSEEFKFDPETYLPPVMCPISRHGEYLSPYNVNLKKMNKVNPKIDYAVLGFIQDKLVDHFTQSLKERGVPPLSPLDVESAINGAPDDPFIRRINAKTSAGFGFDGKKMDHIPLGGICDETFREPTPELRERLVEILDTLGKGESVPQVFTGHLKDEPRPFDKVKAGKTRLFYAEALDLLIAERALLSPFYSLMVEHSDVFFTSVGVNIHQESDELARKLKEFSGIILEGDYSSFDLTMLHAVKRCRMSTILKFLSGYGYNKKSLKALRSLLSDGLFPIVVLLRDVFGADLQPSGKYATAEDNSLCNLILFMYLWYTGEQTKHLDFFKCFLPFFYGDDVLGAVKPEVVDVFNNLVIRDRLADLGMTFTPAAKSGSMTKFLELDECSFLKRKFVFREEYGRYAAPLEINSILKSLVWHIPSASVAPMDQTISTMSSALWEVFFHAKKEQFDRVRQFLLNQLVEHYEISAESVESRLPTFFKIRSSLQW
jgi:hypothetical protein